MLGVRENEIALRKWSGGATAQLRTLEGTRIVDFLTGARCTEDLRGLSRTPKKCKTIPDLVKLSLSLQERYCHKMS